MAAPHHWPEEDCREALRLKDLGMTWRQVGAAFGKSKSAAEQACRRYQGISSKVREDYSYDGPPIGPQQSEATFRKSTKNASEALRRAINALFERMPANDVAEVVGKQPTNEPGTECIYRGQLAERRLAA